MCLLDQTSPVTLKLSGQRKVPKVEGCCSCSDSPVISNSSCPLCHWCQSEKSSRSQIQRLQSAPLVVHSSPVLAAESQCTRSQESAELIPALQPLLPLLLCRRGWRKTEEGRMFKLCGVHQSVLILMADIINYFVRSYSAFLVLSNEFILHFIFIVAYILSPKASSIKSPIGLDHGSFINPIKIFQFYLHCSLLYSKQ